MVQYQGLRSRSIFSCLIFSRYFFFAIYFICFNIFSFFGPIEVIVYFFVFSGTPIFPYIPRKVLRNMFSLVAFFFIDPFDGNIVCTIILFVINFDIGIKFYSVYYCCFTCLVVLLVSLLCCCCLYVTIDTILLFFYYYID